MVRIFNPDYSEKTTFKENPVTEIKLHFFAEAQKPGRWTKQLTSGYFVCLNQPGII
jgi:hypothetical protein